MNNYIYSEIEKGVVTTVVTRPNVVTTFAKIEENSYRMKCNAYRKKSNVATIMAFVVTMWQVEFTSSDHTLRAEGQGLISLVVTVVTIISIKYIIYIVVLALYHFLKFCVLW